MKRHTPSDAPISDRDALTAIGAPSYIGGGDAKDGAIGAWWFFQTASQDVGARCGWM
ncbi:MAG: hypothetical protein ACE360_13140 [Hyphomicrobiales bacterium]